MITGCALTGEPVERDKQKLFWSIKHTCKSQWPPWFTNVHNAMWMQHSVHWKKHLFWKILLIILTTPQRHVTENVAATVSQRIDGLPGALCEYRYSGTEASLEPKSCSWDTGDPSRERHSGVWRPLECGERRPEWVGDAGALLKTTQWWSVIDHPTTHAKRERATYGVGCDCSSRVQKSLVSLPMADELKKVTFSLCWDTIPFRFNF